MSEYTNDENDTNEVSLQLATVDQIVSEIRRRGLPHVVAVSRSIDEQPVQPESGAAVKATVSIGMGTRTQLVCLYATLLKYGKEKGLVK